MEVRINKGFGIVAGCLKFMESITTLHVADAGELSRIDTVVLRLDDNDSVRSCDFAIVQGVPSLSPQRPELTRGASIYEIGLADILVQSNSREISNARITDTRLEGVRCGVITSIADYDPTPVYAQVQADLKEFKEKDEASFEAWRQQNETEFYLWFEALKDVLDENTASHLQNEIGTLALLTTTNKSNLVSAINEVNARGVCYIDVTADPEFAGKEVVLENGDETYTARIPSTEPHVVRFMVNNIGKWTATILDKTASVDIPYFGVYKLMVKNLSFDYTEWLSLAGISQSYASLDDVLADEKALRILFTKHASVDYIASIEEEDENVEKIINNDLCAKWINLRDYALDTLYANEIIKSYMDEADKYFYGEWVEKDGVWQPKGNVPVMTSNTAPYGVASASSTLSGYNPYNAFDGRTSMFWADNNVASGSTAHIIYKFTNPTKLKRMYINETQNRFSEVYIVGSNDGVNYSEAFYRGAKRDNGYYDLTNDEYYLYYKVVFKKNTNSPLYLVTLQFYGRELKSGEVDYSEHEERYYIYDHGVELEELVDGSINESTAEKLSNKLVLHKKGISRTIAQLYTKNKIDLNGKKILKAIAGDNISTSATDSVYGSVRINGSVPLGTAGSAESSVSLSGGVVNYIQPLTYTEEKYLIFADYNYNATNSTRCELVEWWLE